MRARTNQRPALDEVECFLACDPTALYVGELDGKPIAASCVFKYEDGYRHGGGYFVENEYRKRGYGLQLYDYTMKQAQPYTNLTGYVASMDVFKMYKKYFGSAEILHSTELHDINSITALKKLQEIRVDSSSQIKPVSDVQFETVLNYDRITFGYDREKFLHKWLYSPASISRVALDSEGAVQGYAVARESIVPQQGYKIGPLFCEDIEVGKALLLSVFKEIHEQGKSSSVHIWCPTDKNPQVKELLTLLESTYVCEHPFSTIDGQPKGQVDKWFGVTSLLCG